jgi:hypothetical protein
LLSQIQFFKKILQQLEPLGLGLMTVEPRAPAESCLFSFTANCTPLQANQLLHKEVEIQVNGICVSTIHFVSFFSCFCQSGLFQQKETDTRTFAQRPSILSAMGSCQRPFRFIFYHLKPKNESFHLNPETNPPSLTSFLTAWQSQQPDFKPQTKYKIFLQMREKLEDSQAKQASELPAKINDSQFSDKFSAVPMAKIIKMDQKMRVQCELASQGFAMAIKSPLLGTPPASPCLEPLSPV